jgi:DNA-binding NarL/FixJ family response regulator
MSADPVTRNDTNSPLEPGEALRSVVALRQLADRLEDEYVVHAVGAGWTWAQIADALNVTRQAVHKKHSPRFKAAAP